MSIRNLYNRKNIFSNKNKVFKFVQYLKEKDRGKITFKNKNLYLDGYYKNKNFRIYLSYD